MILNLSNKTLNKDQISVLSRGLSFCPTPGEPDMGLLFLDLERFFRTLRLKVFWDDQNDLNQTDPSNLTHNALSASSLSSPETTSNSDIDSNEPFDHPKFKVKSTFDPRHLNQGALAVYQKTVKREIQQKPVKIPYHKNLSRKEYDAIKQLASDRTITIKSADKGSCIVIQNTTDYISIGHKQLSDTKFYTKESRDFTHDFNIKVHNLIDELENKGSISFEVANYLKINKPKTPQFYMLPKIHKGIIPPPGRPILSANDSPTERISAFVDHFLQPFVPLIPSYIKDTTDFVTKIEACPPLPDGAILVTLDVTALYTNIPHWEGLAVIKNLLTKSRPTTSQPTNQDILRLLSLVLTLNHFEFDNSFFTQKGGVAMGSKVSPSFANLFMSNFEEKYVYTYPIKPILWLRFIDDIKMVWTHGTENLNMFVTHLNSVHNSIKFTIDMSPLQINFLDTTVKLDANRKMYTTLYTKPTDSHTYLHYTSAHPTHQKKSGPYSQLVRIRRICTKYIDFVTNAEKIISYYKTRGYPNLILQEALEKAKLLDRTILLTQNNTHTIQRNDNNLIMIITHNPANPDVKGIIQKHWPIINNAKNLSVLHNQEITLASRRPKNLRDKLVRARANPITKHKNQISGRINNPCAYANNDNCKYCNKMLITGKITSSVTKRDYTVPDTGTCGSNNLVYLITCTKCNTQYVGETGNTINQRFYHHFYDIKNLSDPLNAPPSMRDKTYSPLAKHFATNDHTLDDMSIQIIEHLTTPPEDKLQRRTREYFWIQQLKTVQPLGINNMEVAGWLLARTK